MAEKGEKRPIEDATDNCDDSDDDWVGPLPSEAAAAQPTKKRRVLEHEAIYLENLPLCATYEMSYMHRDIITHVVATPTDFVITASCDGHVKFWKKAEEGIEFVKHFRSHLEGIKDMAANCNGFLLCTASADKSVKIFDVVNFDMMNMFKLAYTPHRVEWVHAAREPIASLAITDADSSKIYIYDGRGSGDPLKVLSLHAGPVTCVRYNVAFDFVVSADRKGIVEYWSTASRDFETPKSVKFESKMDTDLFKFARLKTFPLDIAFSPDGQKFATMAGDRHVRLFRTLTGKLILVLDETLARVSELQQKKQLVPHMEFGRRMAGERDIDKTETNTLVNAVFDSSGFFLLYPTMLGVKVLNLETHRVVGLLGKTENLRPLKLALYQGTSRKNKASVTLELEAADNPLLDAARPDPTLFCTAVKKNRFFMFSNRPANDTEGERDVFNEKPSKEDIVAATDATGAARLAEGAVIFTEMGDIHVNLYPREAPKAVENFCGHARNGYFNGHIFHRVIKGFMVQTGDPTGTGSGGESIWGGEFEDEFSPNLKHDKAFTLSMANAGPGTNGSQFFITVAPTPWLDNKHTIFGKVHKGMEVVLSISNAKVNAKTSKPYDDIKILSVGLK